MHVTRWTQPRRRLTAVGASEFFDEPLTAFQIFNFVTRDFDVPKHGGHLSLKVVLSGEELYRIDERSLRLAPGSILFTNAGDEYASVIDRTTEALSVFVPEGEARAALAASGDEEVLLDDPPRDVRLPAFARVPFRATPALWHALLAVRSALDAPPGDTLLERTRDLTATALLECLAIAPATPFEKVVRASVREELMTRLLRARDRIHDDGGVGCSLQALADTACLSPYHFLRRFKEAFGVTPGVYARRLRLDRARRAIKGGERPRSAALRAGYTSVDALARAMRGPRRA
jgi:AraC-like DNA-binding protein